MAEPGFHILVQSPHARTSQALIQACLAPALEDRSAPAPSLMCLVPTRRNAEHMARLLLRARGGALFGNCVLTLDDFFTEVFARAAPGRPVLTDTARLALIEDLLVSNARALRFIGRAAGYPGLVRKISVLFSEFKQNIIFRPQELRDALFTGAAKRGVNPDKAHDLVLLFEEYAARLAALGADSTPLPDAEDVQFLAGSALQDNGFSALFPGVSILTLDGFYDFNPLQRYVLRHALGTAPRAAASLEMEPEPEGDAWRWKRVYRLARRTLDFYSTCRDDIRIEERVPDAGAADLPMRRVAERLFHGAAAFPDPVSVPAVRLLCPRDRRAEVAEIARRIKRLAAESPDVRLPRVAVVFPALEQYEMLIREEFQRHGIPFQISTGRSLASSPVGAALNAMLDAARTGFPRAGLFHFLASPFVNIPAPDEAEAPDAYELDLVARDAQIAGGAGAAAWMDALQNHCTRLEKYGERIADQGADPDADSVAALARAQTALTCFREVLLRLGPLSEPDTAMTPDDFTDLLRSLIRDFGMRERVGAPSSGGVQSPRPTDFEIRTGEPGRLSAYGLISPAGARRNVRALQAFEQVLDELQSGLRLLSGATAPRPRPVRELLDMLRTVMANTRFSGGGRARGGVQVMGLLETRGLDFDTVFLGGLLDDYFPKKDPVEFFLDAAERRAAGIESIRTDITEDRFLFLRLFLTTGRELVATWPALTEERDNIPSLFVDELARHLAPDAEQQLLSADDQHLYCRDDAVAEFGRVFSAPDPDTNGAAATLAAALDPAAMRRMARGMDMVRHRRANPLDSPFQGKITVSHHLNIIRDKFKAPNNTLGVTALEAYARCPFRFFVNHIMGIEAMAEVEDEVTALDRGTLLHAAVERFYRERYDPEENRIRPVPPGGIERTAAEERLAAIAQELIRDMRFSGVFWDAWRDSLLSGLAGYESAAPVRAPGTLKAFLDYEARDPDWCRPRFFESSFKGLDQAVAERATDIHGPALHVTIGDDSEFFIKGKIDRIDTATHGRNLFLVVDYKTYGSKPSVTPGQLFDAINTGRHFQLPVYLLMARRALGADWRPAGAALYALSGVSKFTGKTAHFGDEDLQDRTMQGLNAVNTAARKGMVPRDVFERILGQGVEQNIRLVIEAIHAGWFNPDILDPARAQCEYCEMSRACRAPGISAADARAAAAALPGLYCPEPFVEP